MRGPRPASPRELTAEEAKQLHQLVRAHTSPHAQVIRARIMLQAFEHPESSNQHIAAHVGTSDRQVRTWRKRWTLTRRRTDAPRSGAPRRFSPSGPCARHGHRVSFAQTVPGAAFALESRRTGAAGGSRSKPPVSFTKHGGALAQSRTVAPLAVSFLAAHP